MQISRISWKSVVKNQIYLLRFCSSKRLYEKMFGFIKPFWKDLVPEFYNYFEEYYFNENYSGWQSYIKDRIPSTNNALEHFNRIIKME